MNKRIEGKVGLLMALIMCFTLISPLQTVFANKYSEFESVELYDRISKKDVSYEPISLMIKGQDIFSDTPGIIVNERALVPIAAIFKELGIEYSWVQDTEEIKFSVGGKSVVMQIDNKNAQINGVSTLLPDGVAPRIFSYDGIGRTYVPVRFVTEILGLSVSWINETRTVAINKLEQTMTGAYLNYKNKYPEIRLKVTGEVEATSFVIGGADVGGQDQIVVDVQNTNLNITNMDNNWSQNGNTWIYDIYDGIFGLDRVELTLTSTNPKTTRLTLFQNERRGHDISYDAVTKELVIRLINTVNEVSVEEIYSTDTVVIKTSENPMFQPTIEGNKIIVDVIGSYLHANEGIKELMAVNTGKIKSVTYEQRKEAFYAPWDDITRVTIELTEAPTYDDFYVEGKGSEILVYVSDNPINNFDYVKLDNSKANLSVRLFENSNVSYNYNPDTKMIQMSIPKSVTDLGSFDFPVNDNIVESVVISETAETYDMAVKLSPSTTVSNLSSGSKVLLTFVNQVIQNSDFNQTLVVIDAGHGGRDPGAVGSLVQEKVLTLRASIMLQKELEKQGFKVYMTRSKDEYVNLYDRAAMAEGLNATVFVSIHINAHTGSSANGVEVLYGNQSLSSDKGLAQKIQSELIRQLGATDRGIAHRPNLAVLRETTMPSVLAELGFISNPTEQSKLMDNTYLQKAANSIAKGIVEFLK
ncbi:MAG: N-acetylmuramoyl-L-alanine amidase [Clostridiales bacterium]|nr:N-acetylmuramoyl-L-alanine amidase [Clostridiales bacterium]